MLGLSLLIAACGGGGGSDASDDIIIADPPTGPTSVDDYCNASEQTLFDNRIGLAQVVDKDTGEAIRWAKVDIYSNDPDYSNSVYLETLTSNESGCIAYSMGNVVAVRGR